jgi:hypothetical protein
LRKKKVINEMEKIATMRLPKIPKIEPRKFWIIFILRTPETFSLIYDSMDIWFEISLLKALKSCSTLAMGASTICTTFSLSIVEK